MNINKTLEKLYIKSGFFDKYGGDLIFTVCIIFTVLCLCTYICMYAIIQYLMSSWYVEV